MLPTSPALQVGHATSSVEGKSNLVLLGDILPAPGPQVLKQAALPHELGDQEDLTLHGASLAFLNDKAEQPYQILMLQRPEGFRWTPLKGKINTHVMTFASPRKFWAATDESLISSFTATFCPLWLYNTSLTAQDEALKPMKAQPTCIAQASHPQTPLCQSSPAASHPPSWLSSHPDQIYYFQHFFDFHSLALPVQRQTCQQSRRCCFLLLGEELQGKCTIHPRPLDSAEIQCCECFLIMWKCSNAKVTGIHYSVFNLSESSPTSTSWLRLSKYSSSSMVIFSSCKDIFSIFSSKRHRGGHDMLHAMLE